MSAYRLRSRPGAESFADAWDKAVGWGQDRTIDVGLERALCGEAMPVVRDDRCIAVRHRFDNRLTLAVLNALDRRAAPSARARSGGAVEQALAAADPRSSPPRTENKALSRAT